MTLLLGVCLLALSLPAVFIIDRRAKLLFQSKNPLSNMADADSH